MLQALRALEAERGIARAAPAVALSGHAAEADRVRALDAGFQVHLAKPAHPQELVATLAALAA